MLDSSLWTVVLFIDSESKFSQPVKNLVFFVPSKVRVKSRQNVPDNSSHTEIPGGKNKTT